MIAVATIASVRGSETIASVATVGDGSGNSVSIASISNGGHDFGDWSGNGDFVGYWGGMDDMRSVAGGDRGGISDLSDCRTVKELEVSR